MTPLSVGARRKTPAPALSLSPHGAAVLREPLHHSPNAAMPQGVRMEPVTGWILVSMFVALFNVLPFDATGQQQASGEPTLVLGTGPG